MCILFLRSSYVHGIELICALEIYKTFILNSWFSCIFKAIFKVNFTLPLGQKCVKFAENTDEGNYIGCIYPYSFIYVSSSTLL